MAQDITRRHGATVEMMQLKHGIFDDACISVIASETVCEISRLAGVTPDVRRFRPNVVVRLLRPLPFQEDDWLGGVLFFGEAEDVPPSKDLASQRAKRKSGKATGIGVLRDRSSQTEQGGNDCHGCTSAGALSL